MSENSRKFLEFIWKIENFSYIWNENGDFLESPTFYLEIFDGSAWCLKLYPRGRPSYENHLSVYLERLSSGDGPLGITIDYEIGLLRTNGETEYVKDMKDRCFRRGAKYGFDNLVARERMFGAKKAILLPEDVLTVQCCIFPKDANLKTYKKVIANTSTELEHYHFQWEAGDFTNYNSLNFSVHEEWDLEYFVLSREEYEGERLFELFVSRESNDMSGVLTGDFYDATDLKAIYCKIGVLDSKNSIVKHFVDKFLDVVNVSGGHLIFPLITMAELLENKSQYLPSNKLNLDCDFTLCYGFQNSRIEEIAHNVFSLPVPVDETASTSEIDLPAKRFLYCIDSMPSSLKSDLQILLQEGILGDFTIKVGDKTMRAHRAVLGARSPVFRAMLISNMKESEKNMVDVSDLEEDTVHRMLTFMYTDMAANLDWETAKELYFAANKYDIITLKRICSEVLYHNLGVRNVGEALAFATMHADEYLKEKTIEFICDHQTEVMYSPEWKTFMTEKLQLAAEIMHDVFLKKGDSRHLN